MYLVREIVKSDIEILIDLLDISQLPFIEHKFLEIGELKNLYRNKLNNHLEDEHALNFLIKCDDNIEGAVFSTRDSFDSDMLNMNCYRILDLLILPTHILDIEVIIINLIANIESEITKKSKVNYLFYGLNNNFIFMSSIFNTLVKFNFSYIHTLLTFQNVKNKYPVKHYYKDTNLIIRNATLNDIDQIQTLAFNSFKYSRFHLDSYIDNNKASLLLKTSAKNAIQDGFVDVMFVAEVNGDIKGYYSGKRRYLPELNRNVGEAVISAVDENSRGFGIFSKLDSHLLNWFSDNTDFSEMGTYLINYPVHKTWINKGLGMIRGTHQFSKIIK